MQIAIVGEESFALGFRLAGIRRVEVAEDATAFAEGLSALLKDPDIGIVIVPQAALEHAPGALRRRVEESTTPVVFPLGTQHNEDIRAQIVKIIGVDLWK